VENKSGRWAILGKVIIDATGDGDLAAAAGAPFEKREPEKLQPCSLMFRIGNVNIDKIRRFIKRHPESLLSMNSRVRYMRRGKRREPEYFQKKYFVFHGFTNLIKEAREKGEYHIPKDIVEFCLLPREGEVTTNMANVIAIDGTNALSLSKAEIEGRKRVIEAMNFLKKHVPGFENSYLIETAHHIGVRETRRIKGDYVLTKEDIIQNRKFDDGIAMCGYMIDIHHSKGELQQPFVDHGGPEKGFDIPYRCLLPKGVENLIVAGRCISTTFEAHGSIRVMVPCMAMGQAAGTAAALAVKEEVTPRQLDVQKLRKTLIDQGVHL